MAVVFFEVKVGDNWGNEFWTDYIAPDDGRTYTPPEFVAVEKINRWFYNYLTGSWYQADSNHPYANYYTLFTTHDTVPLSIMAGWIDNIGQWHTFTWDVGKDFRLLSIWIQQQSQGNTQFRVIQGRVKAVIISVEGYCAKGAGYVDYVTLIYTP